MFRTVLLSIIRSLFTVHSAMVYVIQVCRQLSSRIRMELHGVPSWSWFHFKEIYYDTRSHEHKILTVSTTETVLSPSRVIYFLIQIMAQTTIFRGVPQTAPWHPRGSWIENQVHRQIWKQEFTQQEERRTDEVPPSPVTHVYIKGKPVMINTALKHLGSC